MQKWIIMAIAVALYACQNNKKMDAPPVFEGYWADASGMATFEVQQQTSTYLLKNSMGTLEATAQANVLQGKTNQNFPFQLTVTDDRAVYSIMDMDMLYNRITKHQYDSLVQLQTP